MRADEHPYFAGGFLALAHRGGADLAANRGRENTEHAFAQAVALGCDHLETDVHLTRDGVLVAFHDEVLDRVTDRTGRLADLDWAEVSRARIGGVDPIPRLSDLLVAFPHAFFNIDLKSDAAVRPLADELRRHGAQQRVCVGSFKSRRLRRFRRLAGRGVATSASPVQLVWTRFVPLLPRLLPGRGLALQMPVGRRIAGIEVELVTPRLIARAHAAGRQVHVWTIDDRAEMERLIDLGVDGLVSDRIDILREVLAERGLWSAH